MRSQYSTSPAASFGPRSVVTSKWRDSYFVHCGPSAFGQGSSLRKTKRPQPEVESATAATKKIPRRIRAVYHDARAATSAWRHQQPHDAAIREVARRTSALDSSSVITDNGFMTRLQSSRQPAPL